MLKYPFTGVLLLPVALLLRFIHNEESPHEYAISWNLGCEVGDEGDAGGDFYSAGYGVRVCQARDTVIVFVPKVQHGTGLVRCDPCADDPGYYQAGLAILTPPSLNNLWKRVQKGEISVEDAEREFVATNEH